MQPRAFNILLGLQAGSEGKGKVASYLVQRYKPDLIVGNFSPNAGHTVIQDSKKFVTHNIPVASAFNEAPIVLGAGSAINIDVLKKDMEEVSLNSNRLFIDRNAVIITDKHIKEESSSLTRISSTIQGSGAAFKDRIMRIPNITAENYIDELKGIATVVKASEIINDFLQSNKTVFGEMTQGFDLDLLHGIKYPYCTSRPVNPAQFLSDSGVSADKLGDVYGVFRPYPIRVGNASGFSGPYEEAKELTWDEIKKRSNAPADVDLTEYTTTTKRIRRVFEFSSRRFQEALKICNPNILVLNFADHIDWNVYAGMEYEHITSPVKTFINNLKQNISLIGTGPNTNHIIVNEGIPVSRGSLYYFAYENQRKREMEIT